MSENIGRTIVKMREMKIPVMTNKVDFTTSFYHSMTEAAFELLKNLTKKRADIVAAFKPDSSGSNPTDQLSLVDTYLEDLWTLVSSLNMQAQVKLDRPLRFDWACYLYTAAHETNASSAGVTFELMMTLHLKASLHYHIARSDISTDYRNVSEASKHLCIASGVMSYIEVSIAGLFPDMVNRPSEMKTAYCAFLRKYYLACAQQMFSLKAILSSNPLSAKITLSVSEMLTDLMGLVPVTGFEGLFDHLGFMRSFSSALGFKLRAEALLSKSETGQAMGCAKFASALLVEQQSKPYNPLAQGIPKLKYIPEPYSNAVSDLRAEIKVVHDAAAKDNNLIYFLPVPSEVSQLSEPFQGMIAVKVTPYSAPPQTGIIEFCYDTSRRPSTLSKFAGSFMSVLSASFGMGATAESAAAAESSTSAASPPQGMAANNITYVVSTSATPTTVLSFLPPSAGSAAPPAYSALDASAPAPPAGVGITRSDSDLARELDRQLNGS